MSPKSHRSKNSSSRSSHPSYSESLFRDVMLTKAVMPQLDAIVQKAELIVLVRSASERVMSHLP